MKTKTIVFVFTCLISNTLIQAQSKSTPLKNGEKIILAIDDDTKTIVDVLPVEALPDKTTAAKKYPGSTFFTGMLYGESSRSVRPYEFSDIKKRKFAVTSSESGSRSVLPYEFSDVEERHFMTLNDTKKLSVMPQKDAILVFDLSKRYTPGGPFLFRDYVLEKLNFTPGNQFLVMFDEKQKMVVLKAR